MAAALLPLLLGLAGCGNGGTTAGDQEEEQAVVLVPSEVAVVDSARLGETVVVSGSLEPYQVVNLTAQVPGTVQRIRVDRGTAVSEGEVLAVIRAEGIRGQAEGARAAVAAAESQVALARQQLESARKLYEAGAMSEIQFESAKAGYDAAEAQLAAARAQELGAGEAAARTQVRAPMEGVVSARFAEEGEPVNPGQPLFTVVDPSILELHGQVSVDDAAQVRPGQPVRFELRGRTTRHFEGTVARVEPVADPQTRQVGVYVRLRNPGGVVGGQYATGRIMTGAVDAAGLAVPEQAVRGTAANPYVLVVRDGRLVRQPVQLGVRDAALDMVAVRAGLEAGQQVLAAPGTDAVEGVPVRIQGDTVPPVGEEEV
jgi:RND family efflux transporter MFP subunit